MNEIKKPDVMEGSRWDNTLHVEGDDHVEMLDDGSIRSSRRGHGETRQVGDEVLVERSVNKDLTNPCEKYGHKPNAAGDRCRFCGTPL